MQEASAGVGEEGDGFGDILKPRASAKHQAKGGGDGDVRGDEQADGDDHDMVPVVGKKKAQKKVKKVRARGLERIEAARVQTCVQPTRTSACMLCGFAFDMR